MRASVPLGPVTAGVLAAVFALAPACATPSSPPAADGPGKSPALAPSSSTPAFAASSPSAASSAPLAASAPVAASSAPPAIVLPPHPPATACAEPKATKGRRKLPAAPKATGETSLDRETWEEGRAGPLSWKQPKKLFHRVDLPDRTELWTEVVVDAPHGLADPWSETRHWFAVTLRVVPADMPAAACVAMGKLAEIAFPPGAKEPADGDRLLVDGRPALRVSTGIHHYFVDHVLVPVGGSKTVVVSLHHVGDGLFHALAERQRALAAQQLAVFEGMLQSLRIAGG